MISAEKYWRGYQLIRTTQQQNGDLKMALQSVIGVMKCSCSTENFSLLTILLPLITIITIEINKYAIFFNIFVYVLIKFKTLLTNRTVLKLGNISFVLPSTS
jgi:hypothetical protein